MLRRISTPGAVLAFAVLVAACSGAAAPEATTTTTPTTTTTTTTTVATTTPSDESMLPPPVPVDYAGYRLQPTACGAAAPPEAATLSFTAPEDMEIDPASAPTAVLDTSCGRIVVSLDPAGAPEAVNSFAFLAAEGYFDGTALHRIVPGFVIQGGDPTATGRGNPGYAIADEAPPAGFEYAAGTVAMANAGPGTTGSQFFIMLASVPLPPSYTVIGKVASGQDVIDAIASVPVVAGPTGEVSTPTESVYLESVVVER